MGLRLKFIKAFVCMGIAISLLAPLHAAGTRAVFDQQLGDAMVSFNQMAHDMEGALLLTELLRSNYDTAAEDVRWALENNFSWGEIVAFAYIRATTGQSFQELGSADVRKDFWTFTERTGMSSDKMTASLQQFLKRAEKERNSRIFEQMRSGHRGARLPDLGSGFGLFQEGLDFRRLESARPTKTHTIGAVDLLKGGK